MKASAASSTATAIPLSSASCAASPPDRFRLTGPSGRPDPRTHAYRRDIADVELAGLLFAPHYAAAVPLAAVPPATTVRVAPDASAAAVSQLVRGEGFAMLDVAGGWAWGRCLHDGYVGYVAAADLAPPGPAPSHRVVAVAAPVFAAPDIKAPVTATWPIGAAFAGEPAGDFLATAGGYLHHRHVRAIDAPEADWTAVAERMLGQPYLWGGRGGGGIDCSGLVQVALGLAGIAAPRDSDMQRDGPGRALAADEAARRGDVIGFPGHVGLMVDGARLIHATAHAMAVVIEPLADVIARLAGAHPEPILARRRPA